MIHFHAPSYRCSKRSPSQSLSLISVHSTNPTRETDIGLLLMLLQREPLSCTRWSITVIGSINGTYGSALPRVSTSLGIRITDGDILYISEMSNDRVVVFLLWTARQFRVSLWVVKELGSLEWTVQRVLLLRQDRCTFWIKFTTETPSDCCWRRQNDRIFPQYAKWMLFHFCWPICQLVRERCIQ